MLLSVDIEPFAPVLANRYKMEFVNSLGPDQPVHLNQNQDNSPEAQVPYVIVRYRLCRYLFALTTSFEQCFRKTNLDVFITHVQSCLTFSLI